MLDLDDTIADRQATIRVYARRFLSDFGDRLDGVDLAALTAGISRVDGNGYNRNRAVELAVSAGWRASPGADVLAEHWERHFAELTQGRDGLAAVVDAMERAGLRLGVVTNGRTHLQLRKIEALRLRERAAAAGMRAVWLRASVAWPGHLEAPLESVGSLAEVLQLLRLPSC